MKNHLLIFILISLSTFFFLHANDVSANSYETYYVSSDTLNVRSAGASNASIVGELSVGDKVKVYQEQFGWAEIDFNGERAWVAVHLLTKTPPLNVQTQSSHGEPVMTFKNDLSYYSPFQQGSESDESHDVASQLFEQRFSNRLKNWLHAVVVNDRLPLANLSIIIDPGHGGFDPGSIAINGEFEKDLILKSSLFIQDYLASRGANVILTRTDDSFVTLENRALLSSTVKADIFISLHFNAFETANAYGVSSHYAFEDSKRLATYIQSALVKHTQLKNRGTLNDAYVVLNQNSIPATLLELGYITTQADFDKITSPYFNEAVGRSIEEGLLRFLNYQLMAVK